ncbi:peptidylprolyl cis/trans isomerase, NIMA-interacting 1 [Actinidia rufa]|uniref:Peptidylprolyl cis/trans isomerase, NIMA-interacting 1 n=1 Tax=Actinidia rufa TaxID=165716 RepID=A0A7J0F6A2_9ERIC|nr:peptidylprolyl cis/trans isomerase, NIMA-interacting 1 [Actinidia rufa]
MAQIVRTAPCCTVPYTHPMKTYIRIENEGPKRNRVRGLTEIATAFGGAAIGVASGDVFELGVAGNDVVAEGFELRDGGFSGGGGDDPAFWILPRGFPARALVLDQDVRSPNFVRWHFGLLLALVCSIR